MILHKTFTDEIVRRYFWFIALTAIGTMLCSTHVHAKTHEVRVAVLKGVKSVTLSGRGYYKIINAKTGAVLLNGKKLRKTDITATPNGYKVGESLVFAKKLRIIAAKDVTLYADSKKKRYRGNIDIHTEKDKTLLIINTLDLENYVKGVLYHEVPHYWPIDAIKAQAVATRTYALYRIKERADQKFDVTSDIYSQVYGGKSAERHRPTLAAKRTKGEVLYFDGDVLPAYFHSTCGGKTEHVLELWKQDKAPLYGVTCGFCTKSPHYRWKKNFRSKDVQDKLIKAGHKIGLIKTIKVVKLTNSGRVKTLKITDRSGKSITLSGVKFREIIGPNNLKSHQFEVAMKGYYFDLIGGGWGHGVGMCQWGAYQMSRNRHKYKSILKHYYPGATILNLISDESERL